MIHTDILTVSRVGRITEELGFGDNALMSEETAILIYSAILGNESNIGIRLIETITKTKANEGDNGASILVEFSNEIYRQTVLFNAEMEKRVKHASVSKDENGNDVGWGYVPPDSEFETDVMRKKRVEKEKEMAKYPKSDRNFSIYLYLRKNGLDVNELTFYECLIAYEELICQELKSGILELCGMIGDKDKFLSATTKDILPHFNFCAGLSDIYETLDERYKELNDKSAN